MILPKGLFKYIPPSFLAGSLFALYWQTMAPGLSWANYGSDGGDLITAAATRGVAHPTGYPTYLLVARFFQAFPWGDLAFRTNIMSAVFAVGAALLIYLIVYTKSMEGSRFELAGLIAGYSFGLAPMVWSQAVITEVYTLHAFFVALVLFLGTTARRSHSRWLTRFLGFFLGLAIGNHVTAIFLFPVIFCAQDSEENSSSEPTILGYDFNFQTFFRAVSWLFLGMLVYLLIPLRAMTSPAVNWMNPITWRRFGQLVTGQLYQPYYLQPSIASVTRHIQALAGLLVEQFSWLGIVVGIFGVIVFFRPSRLYIATAWVFLIFSFFALIYNTADSYLYVIPALISFSIWIGLGVSKIFYFSRPHFRAFIGIGALVFLGVLVVFASKNYSKVDASRDNRAENFGIAVIQQVPDKAIVFTQGDEALFALWYFHFALERRPDLVIVASELLPYEWYQESVRAQYPTLNLPKAFLWESTVINENPQRPICYVGYDDMVDISCEVAP